MRTRRFAREPEVDPFYDMLFNMLIAFVFCFIVALIAMNPQAMKSGDVAAKAEYIVTLGWPDYDPNTSICGCRTRPATSFGFARARPG